MPAELPEPVAAWAGVDDPDSALVVLFHGRGSDETDLIALADYLPEGQTYVALRGPLRLEPGYTWFDNQGIGRPTDESLRSTMDWFSTWLEASAAPDRPVLLLGFSAGAAFAGSLIIDQPARYRGAAILSGTLPFSTDLPIEPGRLKGTVMLVSFGESDAVIPRELLERTWDYLVKESGADMVTSRDPGGHNISLDAVSALHEWIRIGAGLPPLD